MAWATEVAWSRWLERMATHEVVDHLCPQELQQPRVAQQETPKPRVAHLVSMWPCMAQLGTPKPCETQQASLRLHGAQISERLSVWVEEPQVAQSPGEPPGRAGRPSWW
jgi:hypothetical protein